MQAQTYSKETIESYTELKKVHFEQIKSILTEYFDKEYNKIKCSDVIDLKVSEIVDILMLPFLNNGEAFTLNSFLVNIFAGSKSQQVSFKNELNKVVIVEDLIEILTVLKLCNSGSSEIVRPGKIVSFIYDIERNKINRLIKYCQSLLGRINRVILIGDSFSSISKINEIVVNRNYQRNIIKGFQAQIRSKSALINCIDLINAQLKRSRKLISVP